MSETPMSIGPDQEKGITASTSRITAPDHGDRIFNHGRQDPAYSENIELGDNSKFRYGP